MDSPFYEYMAAGLTEDEAEKFMLAGFWPSEVQGYRDAGISSLEGMQQMVALGISGETMGLLHGVGITDIAELQHVAKAQEDWYTISSALKAGLRSYEALSYIVDNNIDADFINLAAEGAEISLDELRMSVSDASELSKDEVQSCAPLMEKVFGGRASQIRQAHRYPYSLTRALAEPCVAEDIFDAVTAEMRKEEAIGKIVHTPLPQLRRLAQICQGMEDINSEGVITLMSVLEI